MKESIERKNPDKPPILNSWRNIYIFVLAFQALLILLFALIMLYFNS